jgi:hypothetical protein
MDHDKAEPGSIREGETNRGVALDIFYENEALGSARTEICVYGQMVAYISGDEVESPANGGQGHSFGGCGSATANMEIDDVMADLTYIRETGDYSDGMGNAAIPVHAETHPFRIPL